MAEVMAGLQSAEAITGLIIATCKVIKYCKKLAHAHRTAEKVLQRINGFDATLESVKLVLEKRKQLDTHVVPQISFNESAVFEKNIQDAAERCRETVECIQEKLVAYYGKDEAEIKLRDRQKLVKNTPDINGLLQALEAHKAALSIALVILNIHDLNRNQAIDALQTAKVTAANQINVHIDVNALPSTSQAATSYPRPFTPISSKQEEGTDQNDHGDADGERTEKALEGLHPVQKIADSIITSLSASSGGAPQYSDHLTPEDALRHTPSLTKSDSTIDVSEPANPPPIRTPPQTFSAPDEDALKDFIHTYSEQGREQLESCQYAEAEDSLTKAVDYTKILKESTSISLSQLVEIFENLAKAKAGLRCWDSAISIIQDTLINANPLLSRSEVATPVRKRLIIARHWELLGSVYLDKYLKDPTRIEEDWTLAHNNAQDAWKVWNELEMSAEPASLSDDQHAHLHECLLLLIKVYKAKEMHNEAQYYARQLRGRNSSIERSQDDSHVQFRPRSMFSISHATNPANLNIIYRFKNQEINAITALREAVDASDEWTLIQLLNPAPFGCNIPIDERDEHGTALHHATSNGNAEMITALLTEGADIDAVDDHKNTALFIAVQKGDVPCTEVLLNWNNGRVNKRTRHDRQGTLLHAAMRHADTQCTALLLAAEPELLNQIDRARQTALHYCAETGLIDQARVLVQHGAELNEPDTADRYPLYLALTRDNEDHEAIVKLLLEKGASPGYKQLSAKQQSFYDRILNQLNREQERARPTAESSTTISTRASRASSVTTGAGMDDRGRLSALFRVRTR